MKYTVILTLVVIFSFQIANAAALQVSTNKGVYNYGDYLTVTVTVSEVNQDTASMHIVGPDAVRSTAIPVQIKQQVTTISAPTSFNPSIFKEGTYTVEIQYGQDKAETSFEIIDAGNPYMPIGGNTVVSQWASGALSDYGLLNFLAENNAITWSPDESAAIPFWYKTAATWWLEKRITDGEILNALQYLINQKVV